MLENNRSVQSGSSNLWVSIFVSAIFPMALGFVIAKNFPDWRWSHYPFHAMVEGVGAISALIIATLIVILLRNGHLSRHFILVACALIGMGLLDGFHSVLHVGVSFVWLHSIATLVGGVLFAAVWMPESWLTESGQQKLLFVTVSGSLLVGVFSFAFPDLLPVMVIDGQFSLIAKIINLTGGLGFLIGASYFIHDYLRSDRKRFAEPRRAEDMVFANHCLLFGIAGLLFEGSALWDAGWWWWHILRLLAYSVVLVYCFFLFKRGQDQLSASEERIRLINSRVPGIVYQFKVDADGNRSLPYASPTVEKYTGLSAEAVMANVELWFELIHPDDLPGLESSIVNSMTNMTVWEWEGRFISNSGKLCWLHGSSTPLKLQDGSIVWDGVFVDITARKQVEEELNRYRTRLEALVDERTNKLKHAQDELIRKERLATLGQLTATVSHELRNPLGSIRTSVYIINKKCDQTDERLLKALDILNRNIDRCDHIIDELLDFTRITELDLQPVQLEAWLETVIAELIIPGGIRLEKEFLLANLQLSVDTDRLHRAVVNVLENACHAMMDDNRQTVNDNACLHIKTQVSQQRIEIIISDTGTGMEQDVLARIFEPLFSTRAFGVGLGMPTVKQIMEQHGGGIEINSEPGKGTTVILWLPMSLGKDAIEDRI